MDLEDVADELYRLRPEDFVAARAAQVKAARATGDRGLSAAITKLRRPTLGAWLANLLVRERPTEITALVELGEAMRAAQRQLAGNDLRDLSRQRQQVIAALGTEARRLARERGQDVGDASVQELQVTLEAALATANAARELRSGRLVNGLQFTGFDAVELAPDASAPNTRRESAPARTAITAHPPHSPQRGQPRPPTAADRRRRDQQQKAEAARGDSAAAVVTADQQLEERIRHAGQLEEELTALTRQVGELERQLEEVRASATRARRQYVQAEKDRDAASRAADGARERLQKADEAVAKLQRESPTAAERGK